MDSLNLDGFELQDIKSEPITKLQLKEMKELSGSYEALFSRRAKLYQENKIQLHTHGGVVSAILIACQINILVLKKPGLP